MRRDDERGEPKILPNGVVVPACLQINEMTLRAWRERLLWDQKIVVTEHDARRARFSEEEIKREFGS